MDAQGPLLGCDVISGFTQSPPAGLDWAQEAQIVQLKVRARAFGQVPALAGGEQAARVLWRGIESLAQITAWHAVH